MATTPNTTNADAQVLISQIEALMASGDGVESGFKTTEFWLTILAVGVDVAGPYVGFSIPADERMLIAGGLVIAYGSYRTWRKNNGPAKLYAAVLSMFNKSAAPAAAVPASTTTTTTTPGTVPGASTVVTATTPTAAPAL
jgi:hypothetical protein